jgi:fermentation-respiration switch protein FrsA (DUF1100 family)
MRQGDPVSVVGKIAPRPLFLIHGGADQLILPNEAVALQEAAGSPTELWLLPDVGHAAAIGADREVYRDRVMDFFDRALG